MRSVNEVDIDSRKVSRPKFQPQRIETMKPQLSPRKFSESKGVRMVRLESSEANYQTVQQPPSEPTTASPSKHPQRTSIRKIGTTNIARQ